MKVKGDFIFKNKFNILKIIKQVKRSKTVSPSVVENGPSAKR